VAEAVRSAPGAGATRASRPVPFGGRFAIAYAVVFVAFGGAVLVFALLSSGGKHDTTRWSAWKPSKSGFAAAGEIAAHVSRQYRTAGEGQQIVAVQAYPPQFNTIPLAGIARRNTADNGLSTGTITVEPSDHTLVYVLCGVEASRCMLPAQARVNEVVLRREALELSLYALEYLHGVDSIVAFLPPPDAKTLTAVFLRRRDVESALRRPLAQTLPLAKTPAIDGPENGETATIDRLTKPHWFTTSLQRGPTGRSILVLDEPVSTSAPPQ
jgi:hypothetical protein